MTMWEAEGDTVPMICQLTLKPLFLEFSYQTDNLSQDFFLGLLFAPSTYSENKTKMNQKEFLRDCTARLQNTDGFYRERLHCEGFLWQVALFGRNLKGMKKSFYPQFMECFIPQPARDIPRWARELPCLCFWLPKTHFQLLTLMRHPGSPW